MNIPVRWFSLIMAGLIAGTLLGIWMGYNPKNLSVQTFVEQMQSTIKALNTLMPILGGIAIVLTITAAFFQKRNNVVFVTLLTAASFLMISGLITRFGNQPINSIIMDWDQGNIPADWIELRDRWWMLHILRSITAIIAFCLIAWSSFRK